MAWTIPMTALDNTVFTAAQWNAHVRDNLLETMPGKASAANRWFLSTGVNAIAERDPAGQTVATAQTTASTSYAALVTDGPTVTVTTGTTALVLWATVHQNSTTNAATMTSYAVSGATTVAASDSWYLKTDGIVAANNIRAYRAHLHTGLTAGSNTFTMKYKVSAGTGTFADREIYVLPTS